MSNQSDVGGVAVNGGGSTTRRSPLRIIVWLLVVLLLAYLASPYVSFWRFTKVMRAKDRTQMERYVDFRAVRESLKEQLRAKIPKSETPAAPEGRRDAFAGLVERLAPALIDQLVDAFITPDGLVALIADPEVAKQAKAKDPSVLTRAGKATAKELGWGDVNYAFFTGPRDFLIDVNGTKLRYRFSKFRWVLKKVELPLDDVKV
jgi:hypothetical protein